MSQPPNRSSSDKPDESVPRYQAGRTLGQTVIAACQGDRAAAARLEPFLANMVRQDDWRELAVVLRRMLQGERDPNVLLPGLDLSGTLVVRQVLRGLGEEEPPSSAYDPDVYAFLTQLRQQWEPVIEVVVIAARAEGRQVEGLNALLSGFTESGDWRRLAGALRRVLEGERDPQVLFPGLNIAETVVVGEVLRALGEEPGVPRLLEPEGEGADQETSLDDLFTLVAQVARQDAPPGLREELYVILHRLARDPQAPEDLRALCRVLDRVLAGERDPDLSDLPPDLAERARRMLASI